MWLDGSALYAVLKLPISYAPDFWGPQHVDLLRYGSYLALVIEILLPLLVVLPSGHRAKWALLVAFLGFHVGIIATLRIPYANVACIAAVVLLFRDEIMQLVRRRSAPVIEPSACPRQVGVAGVVSVVVVTLLALNMSTKALFVKPMWRHRQHREPIVSRLVLPEQVATSLRPASIRDIYRRADRPGLAVVPGGIASVLWIAGFCQVYQLFDWIDERNFQVRYEIWENGTKQIPAEALFPPNARSVLLQSYLNDVLWTPVPLSHRATLRRSLYERFAARYCRRYPTTGEIRVDVRLSRTYVDGPTIDRVPSRELMRFECDGDSAEVHAALFTFSADSANGSSR